MEGEAMTRTIERAAELCSMAASDRTFNGITIDDYAPPSVVDVADAALTEAMHATSLCGRALWAEAEAMLRCQLARGKGK
jgi:hypothetical protein